MADNKTYTPLLQDVHINVVNMNFFKVSKSLSFLASFSFFPSFFLAFLFFKALPFSKQGEIQHSSRAPVIQWCHITMAIAAQGRNAEQL